MGELWQIFGGIYYITRIKTTIVLHVQWDMKSRIEQMCWNIESCNAVKRYKEMVAAARE